MKHDKHPLLVFPQAIRADREKRGPNHSTLKFPASSAQAERIAPQFTVLQKTLDIRKAALRASASGAQPEQVLVIETIGSVGNFVNAVKHIAGLEWLGELEQDDIAPEFGFEDKKKSEKPLKGQLFLVMTDQVALKQIQSLFEQWQKDPEKDFPLGLAPLKHAFEQLHNIRPWNSLDRLRETGLLEDWDEREKEGQEMLPFEAELWFRKDASIRQQSVADLRASIEELNGEFIQESIISEIAYHGILATIPIEHAQKIAAMEEVRLLQCDGVMHLHPVGQCSILLPDKNTSDGELPASEADETPTPHFSHPEPIIALLDGLPLVHHHRLVNRLIVDDPDAFEDGYPASARAHGTAMASLICHGDLAENLPPLTRPIYTRPILQSFQAADGRSWERMPENRLTLDLMHCAVRRLFEYEGDEPPAAPSVRIINLSVGDPSRMFDRAMSSWARLLDWLSWKYNVLFLVSAGNHAHDIELDVARLDLASLSNTEREQKIIKALAADSRHRRLIAPSESINAITVGALHSDASIPTNPTLIDPLTQTDLPATYNAQGLGYRRSIKPDILLPGGRQFLREKLGNTHPHATLQGNQFTNPPGQEVASPGKSGSLSATCYTRGTSNATALATRAAAQIHDTLEYLRSQANVDLPSAYDAVLIKALLVHGASWGNACAIFKSALKTKENARSLKSHISRFLGYGQADVAQAVLCTAQRATILGVGELQNDEGHIFRFPLPPCLSAVTHKRRLTITLAYLPPTNGAHQNYRVAHLWFKPNNQLTPDRQEADHNAVQRGTVQHEILKGHRAADYQDGDSLAIKVNCREDAGKLRVPVRYAIAVTLEVAEGLQLPIYEEIQERLRISVPIQPISSL